ncbi:MULTISPECIES: hypothetical protein [unclassified Clostridioides]|uniref:hypothetical protein n=1 Tax=unclassified Clostridioides TaxID=2635829 RepID=UPI001D12479C|nr:hypothetical protein [Clostridioides sp. ES-S-0001-02]MCC0657313.1 hypothetical protein [Clostridioides sp. ES-S-0123-01]MCC0672718.1 hypothetical protein [Clostridioides sp. ES-S-0145-01]MCC0679966.1 hypothetical protein [Clostridioides sp. ES-S-0005-03]UDN46201.1 hypothetical protein JJJ25_11610 [Clostridioides sp. ES-S-0173-01]UDN59823.1 hypothetical protein JJC01_08170 [Clostridioides sp. ES-S-0010-02]UDN60653.1 hypothetical protein IC758_12390 [Clostridioides sp. ES-W-0016-02]
MNYDEKEIELLAKQAKLDLESQYGKNIDEIDLYADVFSEDSKNEEFQGLGLEDTPLFEGGPGTIQVQAWKKKWSGYDIYMIDILNKRFIFRTINRFEYKQLLSIQNIDTLEREEIICQTVTLWPEEYNWKDTTKSLAGLPTSYSEVIMEKSGFTKEFTIEVI